MAISLPNFCISGPRWAGGHKRPPNPLEFQIHPWSFTSPAAPNPPLEPQIHPWSFRFTLEPQIHRSTPGASDPPQEAQIYPWSLTSFPGVPALPLEFQIIPGASHIDWAGPRWYGILRCSHGPQVVRYPRLLGPTFQRRSAAWYVHIFTDAYPVFISS